jgi:hypothetical protein
MDVLLNFLDAIVRKWPHGDIKFLDDIKSDITARTKKLTGIDDGFEFHEGDDAAITRYMNALPDFQRATFGTPGPTGASWKRR